MQRNIVEDIEEFQNNKRNKVGFTNLYEIYLYKPESPSGILVVMPHRLLFIPGLSDVEQKLCIDYTGQPAERKEKIDCKAKKQKLKWWGTVTSPVVFRDICDIDANCLKKFLDHTSAFFREVGYPEM